LVWAIFFKTSSFTPFKSQVISHWSIVVRGGGGGGGLKRGFVVVVSNTSDETHSDVFCFVVGDAEEGAEEHPQQRARWGVHPGKRHLEKKKKGKKEKENETM